MFLRRAEGDAWPDLSDAALAKDPTWLAPFLPGKTRLDEIAAEDLSEALRAMIPWDLARRIDTEAPASFRAPTGTEAPIDYDAEGGPAIALRVQEVFGLSEHPSVAGGRIPLTLHLLSPAHRPIQITRDLPGFWRGSLGCGPFRSARPLSPPFLAGGSRERCADRPGEAAGNVGERYPGRHVRAFAPP